MYTCSSKRLFCSHTKLDNIGLFMTSVGLTLTFLGKVELHSKLNAPTKYAGPNPFLVTS